jgi:hypothetical protein
MFLSSAYVHKRYLSTASAWQGAVACAVRDAHFRLPGSGAHVGRRSEPRRLAPVRDAVARCLAVARSSNDAGLKADAPLDAARSYARSYATHQRARAGRFDRRRDPEDRVGALPAAGDLFVEEDRVTRPSAALLSAASRDGLEARCDWSRARASPRDVFAQRARRRALQATPCRRCRGHLRAPLAHAHGVFTLLVRPGPTRLVSAHC